MEGTSTTPVNSITPEALQKAFAMLDEATAFAKSDITTSVEDTTTTTQTVESIDWENDEIKKSVDVASFLVKADSGSKEVCDILVKGGVLPEVAEAIFNKVNVVPEATVVETDILKAEQVGTLVKKEIAISLQPVNETLHKGLESLGQIVKSFAEQNAALVEQNTKLSERLGNLESESQGRKSIGTAAGVVERFAKSTNADLSDENTFNVTDSRDLDRLTDVLMNTHEELIEKGKKTDAALVEGTINTIECHKKVPEYAYKFLAQRGIKLVAPSA